MLAVSLFMLIFRRIFTIDGELFIRLISIAISAKNIGALPRKIFARKTGRAGNQQWLSLRYDRRDATFPTSSLLRQQSRPETWKTGHWRAERDQPSESSVQGYSRIRIPSLNPDWHWIYTQAYKIGYNLGHKPKQSTSLTDLHDSVSLAKTSYITIKRAHADSLTRLTGAPPR